jgi:predicted acetyltransferase
MPSTETLETDFGAYVQTLADKAKGKGLPEGYVPATDFWLVDSGRYVGCVSIRHILNDHLLHEGGHIGYDIRPSERGKGYGTEILRLVLPEAKKLGIEKVLITCDTTNTASKKIIEKNGGIFENEVLAKNGVSHKLRYWISV